MNPEEARRVKGPEDVPTGLTDEEHLAFWETHEVTEEYLEKTEEVSEEERPRPRARVVSLRLDERTIDRLKALAESRSIGYQTLAKQFLSERLYEEEKREGILPLGWVREVNVPKNVLAAGSPDLFTDDASQAQAFAYQVAEQERSLQRMVHEVMSTYAGEIFSGESGVSIDNYDDLNANDISRRLSRLSARELRAIRDYEERNKNRETVLEQLDRRIRSGS